MILREAVAGVLFFGVLASRPELERAAAAALRELESRGFAPIAAAEPVRVYALEGRAAEPHQAGTWRPGVIALRPDPTGGESAAFYLRHELFHEAAHRTCGGSWPLWAEEAAAIAFAGPRERGHGTAPAEIVHLRSATRLDRPLDAASYRTLERLVAAHGWPAEPCAVSAAIARQLDDGTGPAAPLDYVLVSVVSAHVLESAGDVRDARWPPGSLLKMPFAASLVSGDPAEIGAELARSDTAALVRRGAAVDPERWRLLLGPLGASPPGGEGDQRSLRAWLGEPRAEGGFAVEAPLESVALALRASLLVEPRRFVGLRRNGELPGSTLAAAGAEGLRVLRRLDALAKTGTISNARGEPLVGYLAVAWPAPRPSYLAVFRRRGARGAGVLGTAAPLLERWRSSLPAASDVRVKLLSLLGPDDVRVEAPCPRLPLDGARQTTTCGELRVLASAPGARAERIVAGTVERLPSGWLLTTDVESYADAVIDAEAADLRGAARSALRAVIAWNALHGGGARHRESGALCDTTHCMVFRGRKAGERAQRGEPTDAALLRLLDERARASRTRWLPFAAGGEAPWARDVADHDVAAALREPVVLDLVRERRRDGTIVLHATYATTSETLPCDMLRAALRLPGCPARVIHGKGAWRFEGVGEGHGVGLDVARARRLASEGKSAREILDDAYGAAPSRSLRFDVRTRAASGTGATDGESAAIRKR